MNDKAMCKNCTNEKEMIDELAKLMCTYPQCVNYNRIGGCKISECQTVDRAENIYNLGYRKILEGSVVLSKEEYEGKEIAVEMSGGHKLRLTVGKFGEMSRVFEEATRKETAKEILKEIGEECPIATMGTPIKKFYWFKKICKKHGVEVEE